MPAAPRDHDLERFVAAQADVHERALQELRDGRKRSHWMWFVFPQVAGLGRSPTARFYALASLEEAVAYLAHPLLGPRLREATAAVLAHRGRPLRDILGSPDDLKFRSSMTLFEVAATLPEADGDAAAFALALELFCDGERDEATLKRLRRA